MTENALNHTGRRYYAIDFESTGLTWEADPTTVVILGESTGYVLVRETDGCVADTSELARVLNEYSPAPVSVDRVQSVPEFLNRLNEKVNTSYSKSGRDTFVFYNGNPTGTQPGFDVPLIRHTTLKNIGTPFPLAGVEYADLMDATKYNEVYVREEKVSKSAINSTFNKGPVSKLADRYGIEVPSPQNKSQYVDAVFENLTPTEIRDYADELGEKMSYPTDNSQENLYRMFGGEELTYDTFDSSVEAVDAWNNGDYEQVLLHNLADVVMTRFLIERLNHVCAFPRIRTLS